jgi:hydrogenase maturation protease
MTLEARDRRLLVAGIGNVFFGDDGFGVEVVARLARERLPDGVTLMDAGIRGMHLAFELLDGRYDRVIFVDALPQQAPAGTVVVMEPETSDLDGDQPDAHAMTPAAVLGLLRTLGGSPPPILVVGCEPGSMDPGIGLTPAVAAAVEPAAAAVLRLIRADAGDEGR